MQLLSSALHVAAPRSDLGLVLQLVLKSTPCLAQSKQLLRDAFLQLVTLIVSTVTV